VDLLASVDFVYGKTAVEMLGPHQRKREEEI